MQLEACTLGLTERSTNTDVDAPEIGAARGFVAAHGHAGLQSHFDVCTHVSGHASRQSLKHLRPRCWQGQR